MSFDASIDNALRGRCERRVMGGRVIARVLASPRSVVEARAWQADGPGEAAPANGEVRPADTKRQARA